LAGAYRRPAARLDFTDLAPLTFERPDSGRFPSLRLAREALALGGFAPVVLNAANEVAVAAFLARRIGFLDIARIVEDVMVASDAAGRSNRCSRSRRPTRGPAQADEAVKATPNVIEEHEHSWSSDACQRIVSLFTTYLPYFVLVLTLLVFVHEFGHYWVGRRFGIHAEVFSIGFGPRADRLDRP
jgi:hypothetical protein